MYIHKNGWSLTDSDDIRLVLYLIYFPKHLKYQRVIPVSSSDSSVAEPNYGAVQDQGNDEEEPNKAKVTTTPEWRLAVTLGIVVALHLYVDLPQPCESI